MTPPSVIPQTCQVAAREPAWNMGHSAAADPQDAVKNINLIIIITAVTVDGFFYILV